LLVLVRRLLISSLLSSQSSLSLLDFADCLLCEGLLVLRTGVLHLLDVIEGDTFNGSLLSEDFVSFVFAALSLF
jgi:hypothetical protein